ncbi:MAG: ABC transporter substrate-binding protein [Solirubrobacteraceae bacterium]
MNRNRFRILMATALMLPAFAFTACGSDDESSSPSSSSPNSDDQSKVLEEGGQKGGKLTQLGATDVDFLDPGHTYFTAGFQVVYATNRTLYSFKPEDGTNPVPDLAAAAPEISEDKKTVTVKIRPGVKFGPPVDRDVVADDVKYAIERFFSINVGGQYPSYFSPIVGTPEEPTKGVKPISGITTPDEQTVVFKLKDPVGVSFAAALVMPITAPIPRDFAKEFDAKNPSTYNTHVVSSGPYMVANNAEGETTGYKPGKSISLVRNPNWDGEATGDYRPAYLDEIFLKTNATDANVAGKQVLDGSKLILDTNPPANILKDVVTEIKDQFVQVPSGGYRYFPMNTTVKPFDDVNVRRAVMAGFSRDAARKARGGKFVGELATHFLPPEFPGFEEAGGEEGSGVDYLSPDNEKGDLEVAAKYFKEAGFASGKYEGDEEILMIGANVDPGKAQAEVAKAQLEKLGFKVRLRLVPQDAVYTEWCQVPAKKVGMCAGAGWFKDFADPQSMLEPVFKGELITETGNINYSELKDPKIDKAMDEAALLEGDERLQAWADIDTMIVKTAAAIPFLWDKTTLIRSKDVSGVAASYYTSWDLNFTSITQ